MKTTFKKTLAFLLCVWMICTTGFLCFADGPVEDVTSIKLSETTISMKYGGTAKLTATVLPEGADSRVTWKSSDPALVQVDAYGNLTASEDKSDTPSGLQTATITVTSVKNNKVSATCTVKVDNDTSTKVNSMLKTLLATIKSLATALAEPSKEFFNYLIELGKKLVELVSQKLPTT